MMNSKVLIYDSSDSCPYARQRMRLRHWVRFSSRNQRTNNNRETKLSRLFSRIRTRLDVVFHQWRLAAKVVTFFCIGYLLSRCMLISNYGEKGHQEVKKGSQIGGIVDISPLTCQVHNKKEPCLTVKAASQNRLITV